jgi:hypothetical protein
MNPPRKRAFQETISSSQEPTTSHLFCFVRHRTYPEGI